MMKDLFNNKNKFFLNTFFILIIMLTLFYLTACSSVKALENKISSTTKTSITSTTITAATILNDTSKDTSTSVNNQQGSELSEKPDEVTFKEYFTELGLGKLPGDGKLPYDLEKGNNFFVSNGKDQIVIYGNLLKDTKISNAIYDVNAKKNIREKAEFPMILGKGGFASSEPVNLPAGKYEYKIWIQDKLVGVFPFEVKP